MGALLGQGPLKVTRTHGLPHPTGTHFRDSRSPSKHPEPLWVNVSWALLSYFLRLGPLLWVAP